MILNIIIHKNKKINCFTQPVFIDVEPEKIAIQEARTLKTCDLKSALPYKDLDLYFLGVFNDETGEIITVDGNGDKLIHKLCNAGEIVKEREDYKKYVESISTNSEGKEA